MRKIDGTGVEIVEEPPRARIRHAVLDLDGTISLLRDGWQNHMVPLMVEVLAECPGDESREDLKRLVIDFVDHLTGKQTIYQMIRLAEEVEKRGGTSKDPLEYKAAYHRSLAAAIADRVDGLRQGRFEPNAFVLSGAQEFLESLGEQEIAVYLASGTDIELVKEDAELLDVAHHMSGGIFGALSNYRDFSKAKVIRKIITDFHLSGPELLVVGDGFVEIENAREVGAVALGVHSRENNRYHMNTDKRERLRRAGAHFLAPDLTDGGAVLRYLAEGG